MCCFQGGGQYGSGGLGGGYYGGSHFPIGAEPPAYWGLPPAQPPPDQPPFG